MRSRSWTWTSKGALGLSEEPRTLVSYPGFSTIPGLSVVMNPGNLGGHDAYPIRQG